MTKPPIANEPRSHASTSPASPPREAAAASAAERPRRHATLIVVLVLVAAAIGAVWWFNHQEASAGGPGAGGGRGGGRGGRGGFGGPNAPLPVGVRAVEKGDINLSLTALGTITPLYNVTVRAQISGQLMEVKFREGQLVHRGDLLAIVDPRPHEVALEQAQAQLRQAQAQLKTAQLDLTRYETLAKEDSIAKQQVDTTRSQVNQLEGAVQTAQAAIDTQKLNLTYCHVTAPIDGRVGLRQVDQGNYVTPGDANGLVVITQVKPITVIFTLPEDNVSQIAPRVHSGAKLSVDAFDRAQTRKLATGTLTTIDNQIDPTTGTFKLRAEFPNEDESLFPNQFVNVRLLVDTVRDVTVIASSAVERGQQGTYVFVVSPEETAVARPITLGPSEGERVAVTNGLAPGERIVVDGADKLRDGQKVILNAAESGAGGARRGGNAPGGEGKRGQRGEKKAKQEKS